MNSKILTLTALLTALTTALTQCKSEPKNEPTETPKNLPPATTNSELKKHTYSQPHLGTTVQLVFFTNKEADDLAENLSQFCFQRISYFNAIFSDYLPDSELNQLCKKPINTPHKVSPHLFNVIAHAQTIAVKSNGAFDITLGKQTQNWRNKKTTSTPQDQTSYQDLKLNPEKQTITLLKTLQLDLGGIAKGYIADQLTLTFKDAGITRYAIIIGGEALLADPPPSKKGWRIAIQNPEQQIIRTITLSHTALSTSGDSYQFFEHNGTRQSHLIDPTTKTSKTNRLNVITIAPTAMEADAWATALRILPIEKSLPLANQQPHLQALFIPHQQETSQTSEFPTITPTSKP